MKRKVMFMNFEKDAGMVGFAINENNTKSMHVSQRKQEGTKYDKI